MPTKNELGGSLDPDEKDGLIPRYISTHEQLNEWEAANILSAEQWLFSKTSHKDFLSIKFIKLLHTQMFKKTWKWAGTFRITEKNIGVNPQKISTELKNLLDDVSYQIVNNVYPIDEISYRFHHRLVWIHPFPNGNGRHARLMTDSLLVQAGEAPFSWGKTDLIKESTTRKNYIDALRDADKGIYSKLVAFVRS